MKWFDKAKLKLSLNYLADPKKALKVYLLVAFVDLIVFGFFGMYLSLASYGRKNAEYIKEFANRRSLQQTKVFLVDSSKTIESLAPQLVKLDEAIPDESDIHSYLSSVVAVASANGFIVYEYGQASDNFPKEGATLLRIVLRGNADNADKVIDFIETSSRLASIESLTIDRSGSTNETVISLRLFSLPKSLDLYGEFSATIDKEYLVNLFKPAHE
ncbi:MAG: hypothetical protein ACD_22C00100G0009 [uncultured bacterium]|nr:MAG: hypothetical protein ACD_22C00100G0009 [uncultured bacterium]